MRLRESDFKEVKHADGISPEWPVPYENNYNEKKYGTVHVIASGPASHVRFIGSMPRKNVVDYCDEIGLMLHVESMES